MIGSHPGARNPHIFGEVVLARIFGVSPPSTADISVDDLISAPGLRAYFNLPDDLVIRAIVGEREFVLNADFWIIDATNTIQTLNSEVPIEPILKYLRQGHMLPGPAVRMLHLWVTYPWNEAHPSPSELLDLVTEMDVNDKAIAISEAMSLGYPNLAALTDRVRGGH